MAFSDTISAILTSESGWETTVLGAYPTYTQEQKDLIALMVQRRAAQSNNPRGEVLTADRTIAAGDNGTVFFLSNVNGFTVTLPTPVGNENLGFLFIVKTAPTEDNYTVVSGGTDLMTCTGFSSDGAAANTLSAADQVSLTAAAGVAGDRIDVFSDGARWYVRAFSSAASGVTFSAT